jgi:hypothetical protein
MNAKLLALLGVAFAAGTVAAAAPLRTAPEERIARFQARLFQSQPIDTRGLPEETTLARFLVALERTLPAGQKVHLRIDAEAFGKQLPHVASTTIKLPAMKAPLTAILRKALSQVRDEGGVAIGIRPDGVVITRPRLAAHRWVYDLAGLPPHLPELLPQLRRQTSLTFERKLDPEGRVGLLAFLLAQVQTQEWETVRLLNGSRLEVVASPDRHDEIANLLHALRRLTDLAVVANARLYAVDRAFYVKNIAPLFAKLKKPTERPRVVAIESAALLGQITRQKLLLESEDVKLRPGRTATFLARQKAFRYLAGTRDAAGGPRAGIGLQGVSFAVRPSVSPDRRYLRLTIAQTVAQLVGIDSTTKLDVASGKEVEVRLPNVRRTTLEGTVEVPDGNPILMPVEYRPAGKENKDTVWLLVARPYIWIEEEVKAIRRQGGTLTSKAVWDAAIVKEEKPARLDDR